VRRLRSKRRRQVEAAVTRLADHIAIAPITTYDHAGTTAAPPPPPTLPFLPYPMGGEQLLTFRCFARWSRLPDNPFLQRPTVLPSQQAAFDFGGSPSPPSRPEAFKLTEGRGATWTGEEGEGTFAAPSPLEPTSRHVAASYATYGRFSPPRTTDTETCGA
jgi:hypothetical protein